MSIKKEFQEVLIGFEKYSFTEEQLAVVRNQLEMVAHDLAACKHCNGTCMTTINHRCVNSYYHNEKKTAKCDKECYSNEYAGYYGLHHAGCRIYQFPTFAVYRCPGASDRKKAIMDNMTSKRQDWQDRKDVE